MSGPIEIRMDPRRARRRCYRTAALLRRVGSYEAARSALLLARTVRRGDLMRTQGGGA